MRSYWYRVVFNDDTSLYAETLQNIQYLVNRGGGYVLQKQSKIERDIMVSMDPDIVGYVLGMKGVSTVELVRT